MGVFGPWERCGRLPRGVSFVSGAVARTAVLQNTKKNKNKKAPGSVENEAAIMKKVVDHTCFLL